MIKYRILYEEKNKFFRTFNKKYPEYDEYGKDKIVPRPICCHDGQKKLLYSEIEFYNKISTVYNLNDILVVYVGSGHGVHEPIIFDMFPELDFYMIDPVHYKFKHSITANKDRFFYYQGYYTDNSYKRVIEWNKERHNKKIAFICDIRTSYTNTREVDEWDVFNNMLSQQKWCIQLNSVAYLLKLRFPLIRRNIKYEFFQYDIPQNNNTLIKKFKKYRKNGFKYLKGKIMVQIYAPSESTETRLLHVRKSIDEQFDYDNYDIFKYNFNCFYFNFIDKLKIYKYKESDQIKEHVIGYDDSYESVCEYYIMYHYFKEYKKEKPTLEKIIKLLEYNINNYNIFKNNILCNLITIRKKINNRPIRPSSSIKNDNYFGDPKYNIKTFSKMLLLQMKFLIQNIIDIQNSLKIQADLFDKSKILSSTEIKNNKNKCNDIINEINTHYNDLFCIIYQCEDVDFDKLYTEYVDKQEYLKKVFEKDELKSITKEEYFRI
jgi:hypothetical protein